ncbi:FtsX-like permease family protein [Fodinicola acaciae]|uniref:FtsX-like permease family protein n=1 Tax=Fodinicola acaciae TaxID=2681555 RepID=UPI0013D0B458|nr:FtsX-like permease family protein [Fodinicola acaciae]
MTVLVVAVIAMTAAVVGPAYARAAEQSLLVTALRAISPAVVGMRVSQTSYADDSGLASALRDAKLADPLLDRPVTGVESPARFDGATHETFATYGLSRTDVCAHIRMVAGTCKIDGNSALLSKRTADRAKVRLGDTITLQARPSSVRQSQGVVAGIYQPLAANERYWLGQPYFQFQPVTLDPQNAADSNLVQGVDPVIGGTGFVAQLPGRPKAYADVALRADDVRLDDVDRLTALYSQAASALTGEGFAVEQRLTTAIEPVTADRQLVALSIPLVAAELVLIAWFILILVVSDATEARGPEIALARLRGYRSRSTTVFGLGESLLLVVVAAPIGLGLGLLVTELIGRLLLAPGVHVELRLPVLLIALLALGGGLAAAAAAGRRVLGLSVAELLRRVPPRQHKLRAGIVDGLVAALALAALVQVLTDRGRSSSPLSLVAPGMLAVVTGIAVSRLVPLLALWRQRSARRRGRLAEMVGWTPLARRTGGRRSALVVTVAVALLFFSAIAWDTAAADRKARAAADVGADRAVTVRAPTEQALLQAVRSADPTGRYAMAAVKYAGGPADPIRGVLAVDASRLAAVARWDRGELTAPIDAIARDLSKPAPSPVLTVRGPRLSLSVTVTQADSARPLSISLDLRDGHNQPVSLPLGTVRPGGQTLTGSVAECAGGCRFESIRVTRDPLDSGRIHGMLAVTGLADNGKPVAGFADSTRWQVPEEGLSYPHAGLSRASGGLGISFDSEGAEQIVARRADVPSPLPAVLAGSAPPAPAPGSGGGQATTDPDASDAGPSRPGSLIQGSDLSTQPHTYVVAARAAYIPSVGASGLLVNLEYLDRISNTYGRTALVDQVWLAPDAPPSITRKLAAAGILPVDEQSYAGRLAELDQQGPTLALRLYLVAAVAALLLAAGSLAVAAYLDGRVRAYEFGVLRLTGVSRPSLRRAARIEQLVPAVIGCVAGVVAGALGALLALPAVPVFSDSPAYPRLDYVPGPVWPVAAAVLALVVLAVVAALVAARSERGGTIRRVQEGQQ